MAQLKFTGGATPFDEIDIPDLGLVNVKRGDVIDVDDPEVVANLLDQGTFAAVKPPRKPKS